LAFKTLEAHREPEDVEDQPAPVRGCYRYLSNRIEQLDYQTALDNELPIGSGEIESAHRYIIQERLKLPGAGWESAKRMIIGSRLRLLKPMHF
jgi:hypothetical protein